MIRKALLLVLLLSSSAFAATPGMDYLGGAKYCDTILKAHPQGWAAGFFIDTFGDAVPCIERLARSGKANTFRIHLAWSDSHTFRPNEFDGIAAKAGRVEALARKFPSDRFYISGACEHNLDATQAKILRAKVLAKCPSCAGYVNTPWRGAKIDGINEVHGSNVKAPSAEWFTSFDGTPAVDSDVAKWKRDSSSSRVAFLWEPRFNGRWEDNDKTPRPLRKGWPDSKLIQSVQYLWNDKGATNLKAPNIYKSHSENKGNGDSRAEKPVAILAVKAPRITLVTSNGKEIASAGYYGSFEGGRSRYYFSQFGFELAEKARAVSGSPLVTIRANGKSYGLINPAFRDGSYR